MRIAYFDPFSGASGDMILGALVDAGAPVTGIAEMLAGLGLPGWTLTSTPADQHGIHGARVTVTADDDAPARDWSANRALIERSVLPTGVKNAALEIFGKLAEAEAAVHGSTVEHVHFHEVGGIDAIVDICGACCALALLRIDAVYSGPPRTGSGFAKSQHGIIPVPAPATAKLLAMAGAPLPPPDPARDAIPGELLTPTGAAILTTLADFSRPAFTPSAIGYGFGQKELPWPNALRVWIGDMANEAQGDAGEVLIETNIDDMSPQHVELLIERLFAAGALDAWTTPIVMKKGRPAIMVSALGPVAKQEQISATMIEQSTTLGVRVQPVQRTKAIRRIESVTTKWGDVRVKIRGWQGRVIDVAPEYDDCAAIARAEGIPLRDVWNEAHRIAGVYVGRRIGEDGEWVDESRRVSRA